MKCLHDVTTAQRNCPCDPACICRIEGNCITTSGDMMPAVADHDAFGCPQPGSGGRHSESYGDDGDGTCKWCGAKPPSIYATTKLNDYIHVTPAELLVGQTFTPSDFTPQEAVNILGAPLAALVKPRYIMKTAAEMQVDETYLDAQLDNDADQLVSVHMRIQGAVPALNRGDLTFEGAYFHHWSPSIPWQLFLVDTHDHWHRDRPDRFEVVPPERLRAELATWQDEMTLTEFKPDEERAPFVGTPEEVAAYEAANAQEQQQYAEWEAAMLACTVHTQPGYSDPEADGCPSCGWGMK